MQQCVIHRTITVAPGRFAPGHLGELTQQVPFELVDAVLAQTGTVQSRVRDLPARVVVYLLLAGCLFAELGYVGVWQRLVAGLGGLGLPSPTAGALTKARRRVGAKPLQALFDLLRGPAATTAWAGVRWCGLLVCAIDATTMSVADTPPTLAPSPPTPATTAGRGIRCCAWWRWWPAAPAASSTRPSAPSTAGRPPMPGSCCAASGRA